MVIDVRAPGLRLSRARALAFSGWVRHAFSRAARGVARVALRITPARQPARHGELQCVVEVHLPDGTVSRVQESHRRVGLLVRRAVLRAVRAAAPLLPQGGAPLPVPRPPLARRPA